MTYGPFGETDQAVGPRFRYTGQQWLGPLNLYYYKARMYAPVLGRFLQTDPIGYADGLNWYAYTGNDPINRIDPTGLESAHPGSGTLAGLASEIWQNNPWLAPVRMGIEAAGNGEYGSAGWYALGAIAPLLGRPSVAGAVEGGMAKGVSVGYHATLPEAAEAIATGGFRLGTKPGRLGSGGVYVNNTAEGAIAEFAHHNPGVTPSVLEVSYSQGVNATAGVAPRNYVTTHPLNVDSISAPSVRAPGTVNTNVLNGSATPVRILP